VASRDLCPPVALQVLVAVWSLSIAGTCIGIIGALSFTSVGTGAFEGCLHGCMQRRRQSRALAQAAAGGMDLQEFKKVVRDTQPGLADAEVEALFRRCDADDSGALDETETRVLLATLDAAGRVGRATGAVQPFDGSADLRSELEEMRRSVQALHEKVDRLVK
jgi:hypothetical protein